ncbi:MAG TPA: phage portal protein [Thermomicrobiales bacterium]|nr:phage portal protein [Thermomicrobiales bacterium]
MQPVPAPPAGRLAAWLLTQDTRRMNRYREYLDFYDGRQWAGARRAGESRLVLNYARVLVRKAVAYLMPAPVAFDVLPGAEGAPETTVRLAERALAEVYDALDQHAADVQSALDAAVLGDGAFKVTWSERHGRPVVAPIDPSGLWAWWEPDDPRTIYRAVQRYHVLPEEAERLFGPAASPASGGGRALTVVEDWRADRYRVELDGATVVDAPNPYGWAPYVIYPNVPRPHEFWGASDLEDLLDVCRELNQRMTTISRILQVSGYPVTVLENVTGSEGIRAEPGAIWELPEDSKAYLLDMLGGGIGLHIDYVNLLYRQLHDLSETPRTAFGDSGRSLSGVALEVEIQPLVQKVTGKRRVWDAVYARRNALVLDLLERFGGLPLGGLRRTRPIWKEILPSDREELVRGESRLVAAGIHSRRQSMAALGDPDPDRRWAEVLDEMAALRSVEDVRDEG